MDARPYGGDRIESVLFGAEPRFAGWTLVFAGASPVSFVALQYANLRTGHDVGPLVGFLHLFDPDAGGAAVAVVLAGAHAFLNEGYVSSVTLAAAPTYGTSLWFIGSPGRIENLYLGPWTALDLLLPGVLRWATVGFLVGMGPRVAHRRLRGWPPLRPPSRSG